MRHSIFFLVLIFTCTTINPASAISVSFADIHMISSQKIDVYQLDGVNATHVARMNSTDQIVLDPTYNYQFVLLPDKTDWYKSMTTTLEYMTTSDGGQLVTALAFFAIFGGGFIAIGSRLWR